MQLRSLKVEQFRGFASAVEIPFHDQFTLIAGENGLGKSSILWALRVLLSQIVHAGAKRSVNRLNFRVVGQFELFPRSSSTPTISSIDRRRSVTPAFIEGVERRVIWTRAEL